MILLEVVINYIVFLDNTQYIDKVLKQLNDIPYIDIKLDDYISISFYLYDYFEESNIIEIIIEYLNYNLLNQLIKNGIDINKIDYI